MDSAAYFGRYEERTASTFMQRTSCFVAVKDRRNVYGRRRLFCRQNTAQHAHHGTSSGTSPPSNGPVIPRQRPRDFPNPQRAERAPQRLKRNRSKDDWFLGGSSTAKDDDAYFERRVQRTAPTMARPAGRTPH